MVLTLIEMLVPEGSHSQLEEWKVLKMAICVLVVFFNHRSKIKKKWEKFCESGFCSFKNFCKFLYGWNAASPKLFSSCAGLLKFSNGWVWFFFFLWSKLHFIYRLESVCQGVWFFLSLIDFEWCLKFHVHDHLQIIKFTGI